MNEQQGLLRQLHLLIDMLTSWEKKGGRKGGEVGELEM